MNKWNLGVVGVLQMVFYSITIISIGLLYFGEHMTIVQQMGVAFALIGIVLMNL